MSAIPCRMILADHASRLTLWQSMAGEFAAPGFTQIDPRPFACWDVSALSLTYQVGPNCCSLFEILPALDKLQLCRPRLCYARDLQHVLVFLERRERTAIDVSAMQREIETLIKAAQACSCEPFPANGNGRNGAAPRQELRCLNTACLPPDLRILVLVDDEMMVRGVIQRILQKHFLVIETAGSLDALHLAERLPVPVHVLLSDITLPSMDGVALAQHWRQRRPETRILLLSGHMHVPTDPDIEFLQKPFFADELQRRVLRMATPLPVQQPA